MSGLFLIEGAEAPAEVVEAMGAGEMWGWFTRLAHTLPYDMAVCGPGCALPAERLATVTAYTLAIGGGESHARLRAAARAVADAIPGPATSPLTAWTTACSSVCRAEARTRRVLRLRRPIFGGPAGSLALIVAATRRRRRVARDRASPESHRQLRRWSRVTGAKTLPSAGRNDGRIRRPVQCPAGSPP